MDDQPQFRRALTTMQSHTVRELESGRCRVHKFTGNPFWCSFDYIIEPNHIDANCRIEIGPEPDAETQRWFPYVETGIRQGIASLAEHYDVKLEAVIIRIPKVYSHPVATSERACMSYGRSWIIGFGNGGRSYRSLANEE